MHCHHQQGTADVGRASEHKINAEIRQGCPLSGLLLNLVLDPLIWAVQGGERQHKNQTTSPR